MARISAALALRSVISFRSAPAEKARPVPVTMPANMALSLLKSRIASSRSRPICPPRAFRRSGRFIVKMA